MSKKWSPEHAKQESENKVLKAFTNKTPQRWSELLENTKLSSKTLKNALSRMEKKNQVYRKIKTGSEYPPPVLYGLTSEGKEQNEPFVFASEAAKYTSGYDWLFNELQITQKGAFIPLKSHFEEKNPKEILAKIGKRISALYFYALLKTWEEQNPRWEETISNNLVETGGLILHFFNKEGMGEGKIIDEDIAILEIGWRFFLSDKDIQIFQDLLRDVYPEEIEMLENILRKIRAE